VAENEPAGECVWGLEPDNYYFLHRIVPEVLKTFWG